MNLENAVWTRKYQPKTLDDVIGNEEQVNRLKQWIDDDSMPHLMLHGKAGIGKSAAIEAFARDKYGDDFRSNLLEFNASDDRGIDVIRNQVKSAAKQSASGKYSYKILLLEEADSLTKDAQAALRRIMEKHSDQTRFVLTMNWPSKVIDPIKSRTTPLPFRRLDNSEIKELSKNVLEQEDVDYEESVVDSIAEHVNGDARKAIHTLQTSVQNGKLTEDIIQVVGGQVEDEVVEEMISDALNGEMENAHELVVTEVLPNVTDYSRFVGTLMSKIQDSDELPRDVKFYSLSQLGDLERNIMEGANPHVQINSYLARLPVVRYSSIPAYEGQE